MKNVLFSTKNSQLNDLAILILRLGFGFMMIPKHGWNKLMKYDTLQHEFMNFMGLGSKMSLNLVIFSELFCSIFIMIGLMTRLALIPLIITAIVILYKHDFDIIGKAELGMAYLLAYVVLLILGPGKYSIDYQINRRLASFL